MIGCSCLSAAFSALASSSTAAKLYIQGFPNAGSYKIKQQFANATQLSHPLHGLVMKKRVLCTRKTKK